MQSILLPLGISLGVSFDGMHAILSIYCTRMNPKAKMTESRAISLIGDRGREENN
jgi:galactitol-specific phosphotransferase system IIC component